MKEIDQAIGKTPVSPSLSAQPAVAMNAHTPIPSVERPVNTKPQPNGYHANGKNGAEPVVAGIQVRSVLSNEQDTASKRNPTVTPVILETATPVSTEMTTANSSPPTVLSPADARAERVAAKAARLAAWRESRAKAREALLQRSTAPSPPTTGTHTERPQVSVRKVPKRWSALFWIGIPTIICAVYICYYAADQYSCVSDFAITSVQDMGARSSGSGGGLSSLLGGGDGSVGPMTDQYIVSQYVMSLQMLNDLKPRLDLRKIYSKPTVDWWSRLKDPNASDEELLKYWQSMVTINYDMNTGLSEVTVRAFTPEDAKNINEQILALSEELINRLSERSRNDAVRLAKNEVDLAYKRAANARDAVQTYAETSKQISPTAYIQSHAGIQASLESSLISSQSELDLLRKNLPEDAPGISQLKNNIAVIQSQLSTDKVHSTEAETPESPNKVATAFGKLQMESEFATQAYMSALTTLENAQLQSISQSTYVEVFVRPQLPSMSEYPDRLKCIVLTLLVSAVIWTIGSFVVTAIREH